MRSECVAGWQDKILGRLKIVMLEKSGRTGWYVTMEIDSIVIHNGALFVINEQNWIRAPIFIVL